MIRHAPFTVIPWREDFLQGLVRLALEETGGNISRAEFIFPHSRPRRYLSFLLQQEPGIKRPVLMPRMHTVSSVFTELSGRVLQRPAWSAGLLDRVGLLLACVRAEDDPQMPFLTDARMFFPWGIRLASLFEECFVHNRKPLDFHHIEDQVSPFAAMLLTRLGRIFKRYQSALKEREWSSPGFDASVVADWLKENPFPDNMFGNFEEKSILFIAGFHALSGTEDILFRHLWETQGARVVLHADPNIVTGRKAHWSCQIFSEWAKSWKTGMELFSVEDILEDANNPSPKDGHEEKQHLWRGKKADNKRAVQYSLWHETLSRRRDESLPAGNLRYFAGFDLHSQLAELQRELKHDSGNTAEDSETNSSGQSPSLTDVSEGMPGRDRTANRVGTFLSSDDSDQSFDEEAEYLAMSELDDASLDHRADTLVGLTNSGLLMPVLHHLPRVDVNVTMGYPLSRSPLFRLLDTLARLQEGRGRGGYYWRDLVDLIRHPYLKMLRPESSVDNEGSALSLRKSLHLLEGSLREQGRKYSNPFETALQCDLLLEEHERPGPAVSALRNLLLSVTLTAFEGLERPVQLAHALENLCSFLLAHGRHLWKRFPIDAECLHRLRQSLIPELGRSELAEECFSTDTLFSIMRSLLEAERVPFEAAPLVGLQVMGMLETRLLTFRRVIIVDAGEDSLPGISQGDPLLPEALRAEIGLPALHSREQVSAYTFFRLINGAQEVVLLWQEGGDTPGIQEQRKKKSRFVEELLWNEEKRLGRLLSATGKDGPLTVIESAASPIPRGHRAIVVSPQIRGLLDDLLKRPVSASLLDSYMRCPVRFFYERAAMLAPADEVKEGDDPVAVGNLFHEVLEDVYAAHCHTPLPGGDQLADLLENELTSAFFSSLRYHEIAGTLPADSRAMLDSAARKRLKDYLKNQPETLVLSVETALQAVFSVNGHAWSLTGLADRIDCREFPLAEPDMAEGMQAQGIVILDYKTGYVPMVQSSIWEDERLWQRMEAWQPEPALLLDGPSGPDYLLKEMAERMESLQLPFYLLLHKLAAEQNTLPHVLPSKWSGLPALDAVWVPLGTSGQEMSLFPQKFTLEQRRNIIENHIPKMVFFLLRHMKESPVLLPCPGKHCRWCLSAKSCILTLETE